MAAKKINEKQNLKIASKIFKAVDFKILSQAVQAVYSTSSTTHGGDCIPIALTTSTFLNQLGINAQPVIGEAMWRVDGHDGGACITHASQMHSYTTIDTDSEGVHTPVHAWIKLNEVWNLDITTYQFPLKMAMLDRLDGKSTPVSWRPTFLLFKTNDISTFSEVQNAFNHGVAYYKAGGPNAAFAQKTIEKKGIDKDALSMLLTTYNGFKSGNLHAVVGQQGEYCR